MDIKMILKVESRTLLKVFFDEWEVKKLISGKYANRSEEYKC